MRQYLTELIGTFFLVLTIGLCVTGSTPMPPIAIGMVLMVMVYAGGHVSGAHYNPAVSLGILMRGKLPAAQFLPYVAAQVLGAFAGACAVRCATGLTFAPHVGTLTTPAQALMLEALYTFALTLVVLHVATSRHTGGNSYYGLAIGGTVCAAAFAAGGLSGGAFNPAVGIGPTVVNAMWGNGSCADLWIYIVGPFAGAAAAAVVFRVQEGPDTVVSTPEA